MYSLEIYGHNANITKSGLYKFDDFDLSNVDNEK